MITRTRLIHISAALTAMAGIAACGGSAATGANATAVAVSHVITLKDIQFHPSELRIARGDRVTWRWEDADVSTQHNVTSIGSAHFKNSSTTMTGSYIVTFAAVGTYAFECSIHPASMEGKIVVN